AELAAQEQRADAAEAREAAVAAVLGLLRTMSGDVQAILDGITEHAGRLTASDNAVLGILDVGRFLAVAGWVRDGRGPAMSLKRPRDQSGNLVAGSAVSPAVAERRTISVSGGADAIAEHFPGSAAVWRGMGREGVSIGSAAFVPLVQREAVVGVLCVRRASTAPYSAQQIALLEAFTAQAVVALENARLFHETQQQSRDLEASNAQLRDALDQQTATATILQAISTSPTDPSRALRLVLESAARFTGVPNLGILQVHGDTFRLDAVLNPKRFASDAPPIGSSWLLAEQSFLALAIREARTVHVADLRESLGEFPDSRRMVERGVRTAIAIPLLHDGRAIGLLTSIRPEVQPYTPGEIALFERFAAHAAIALKNARVYRELREALEQQSTMATVLSAVARAGSEPEPVLFDIAEQAGRLLGCDSGSLYLFDSAVSARALVAYTGPMMPEDIAGEGTYRQVAPNRVVQTTPRPRAELARSRTNVGEVLRSGRPAQLWGSRAEVMARYPDMGGGAGISESRPEVARLAVPLLVQGEVSGILQVSRWLARPFTEQQVALLQSFADQAVIAVQNARLLQELQASNAGLRESLERQTATAEVLRIISGSPTEVQPVFVAIAESAHALCAAEGVAVWELDGMDMVTVATIGRGSGIVGSRMRLGSRSTVSQRAIIEGRTIHIPDGAAEDDPAYASSRAWAQTSGVRTVLSIPLLLNGQPLGAISLHRYQVQPFSDTQIALVQTFADQAVIAIENARLFSELQESLAQQTATADVLGIISGSPGDQQAALGAITEAAFRLCHADGARVFLREGDELVAGPPSSTRRDAGLPGAGFRASIDPGAPLWQAVLERNTVCADDMVPYMEAHGAAAAVVERTRSLASPTRSGIWVPLVHGATAIGVLALMRTEVRSFNQQEIALAETFAAQAVIAIENARLFNETQRKSKELEELNQQLVQANRHKSAFLSAMSHELRTPLNAVIGYSEILAEDAQDAGHTDLIPDLEKINAAGKHLL
ncbi:MAG: GAF domain-containing protein, partial [Dehalococcoidia bacterium]